MLNKFKNWKISLLLFGGGLICLTLFQNCQAIKYLLMPTKSKAATIWELERAPYLNCKPNGTQGPLGHMWDPSPTCEHHRNYLLGTAGVCSVSASYSPNPRNALLGSNHMTPLPGDCYFTITRGPRCEEVVNEVIAVYCESPMHSTAIDGVVYCEDDSYWAGAESVARNSCLDKDLNYVPSIKYSRTLGKQCPSAGDPIHIASGNKYEEETDIPSYRDGGISFSRFYNAFLNRISRNPTAGKGWVHSYDRKMAIGGGKFNVLRPDGRIVEFNFNPSPRSYVAGPGVFDQLVDGPSSGYVFTSNKEGVVEQYDYQGKLVLIKSQGKSQRIEYLATGMKITDSYGRTLTLAIDNLGRVTSATDSLMGVFQYSYENDLMTVVTKPDAKTRRYHYSNNGYLEGITNESGIRYVSWTYDNLGRAISNSGKGGDLTIAYNSDGTVTTIPANGSSSTYSFELINGELKPVSVSNGVCNSSCSGPSGNFLTYWPDGNVKTATTDGVVTYFEWNTKGQEVKSVYGYGTSKARTTITEWHPSFNLVTKVTTTQSSDYTGTYSNLVSLLENNYDPNGNLLQVKRTSGTDVEVRDYTYDTQNRKLTESFGTKIITYNYNPSTGLLDYFTDNSGGKTIFTYDSYGRVKSRSGVAGCETCIDKNALNFSYTSSGKPLQVNVGYMGYKSSTTYGYDELDRLKSIKNFNGDIIIYNYVGNTDQIKSLINADGRKQEYEYTPTGQIKKISYYDKAGVLYFSENTSEDLVARTRTLQDSGGRSVTVGLDNFGRVQSQQSVMGNSVYQYDEFGNVQGWSELISTNQFQAQFTIDGLMKSFTDSIGTTTSFTYDGLSRIKTERGNNFGSHDFTYKNNTGLGEANNTRVFNKQYDTQNRLKSQNFTFADGGAGLHEFAYASTSFAGQVFYGKVSKSGVMQTEEMITEQTIGYVKTKKILNPLNQTLYSVVVRDNGLDGKVKTRTYPSGATVDYSYTGGKITGILVKYNELQSGIWTGVSRKLIDNVQYDGLGRVKSWNWNGLSTLTHVNTFDATTKNLTQIKDGNFFQRDFTYNNKDQIFSMSTSIGGGTASNVNLVYNPLGRLSQDEDSARLLSNGGNNMRIHRLGAIVENYTRESGTNRLGVNTTSSWRTFVQSGSLFYWMFNENSYNGTANEVIDSSGNNRHGKLSGAVTNSTGLFGKALNLSSTAQSITMTSASLGNATESFSAQMWVKSADMTAYKTLMGRMDYSTTPYNGWILQAGNGDGKLFVRIDTSAGSNQTTVCGARKASDPVVMDDRWHHVMVVFNNGNCKLYIDGNKYGDGNYNRGNGFTPNTNFFIASSAKSQIDETAYWSRPLTENEIQQMYLGSQIANTLTYNADGHATKDNFGTELKYDSLGNLESYGNYNYIYDHNSFRIAKVRKAIGTNPGEIRFYSYDNDGRLLGEYTVSGTTLQTLYEIIYLGEIPVGVLYKKSALYLVAADQVGAPRVVMGPVSATGVSTNIVWSWNGSAYGYGPAQESVLSDGNKFELNLRFPGQVFDKESGLHYNISRYYDPKLGRYLQADRIGLDGGPNPYLYVDADPAQSFDPNGRQRVSSGRVHYPSIMIDYMSPKERWMNWAFPVPDGTIHVSAHGNCGGRWQETFIGNRPRNRWDPIDQGSLLPPSENVYVNEVINHKGSDVWKIAEKIKSAPGYRPCMPILVSACSGSCKGSNGEDSIIDELAKQLPNHRICGFNGSVKIERDPFDPQTQGRPYLSQVLDPVTDKPMPMDKWVRCISPKPGTCNATEDGPIRPNSLKNLGRPGEVHGTIKRN